jgi:hypothetical protein
MIINKQMEKGVVAGGTRKKCEKISKPTFELRNH